MHALLVEVRGAMKMKLYMDGLEEQEDVGIISKTVR